MHAERRSSYRIALPPQSAFVEDPASHTKAPLRALNAGGGAVAFPVNGWWKDGQPLPMRFQLGEHPAFSANIALLGPASPGEGDGLAAFRFQNLGGPALDTLSAFLCEVHASHSGRLGRLFASRDHTLELGTSVGEPSRCVAGSTTIATLLRHYLVREKVPLFVCRDATQIAVPLHGVEMVARGEHCSLLATASREAIEQLDESVMYVFFYASALSVTWWRARVVKSGIESLVTEAPTQLSQAGFRCSRRVPPPFAHPLTATIEDPRLCGERIAGPILEVGSNGFALEFDPRRDHLFPGQPLSRVRVDLPQGSVALECILRMCRNKQASGTMIGGFEITGFGSPQDHDRWMRCLIPCLFGEARLGDEQTVVAAWERLERSGYLELIDAGERVRLRPLFFEDWTRHAAHTGVRARFLLSHEQGTAVGVAAANLIYPKTCLVHSGGIDRAAQGSGRVLNLYSASFLFAHGVGEYCLSMFDAEKSINAVLFQRFLHQYSSRDDNVFDGFTVHKWHASTAVPLHALTVDEPIDVVSSTGELLRVLWDHQRRTLTPLELDAYGFSPDNGAMQQFSAACARHGYERQRHIFFALRQGRPVAALVAETGSEGMNAFSLLNACTPVFFTGGSTQKAAALRALLARAVDLYNGAGKGAFLVLGFDGVEREARLHELGLSYVAQGWRWLAAKRVIPAYLSYLQDLSVVRQAEQHRERRTPRNGQPIAVERGQ